MNLVDLLKATIVCGLLAFLCYTFPVVGQILVIGFLSLLWLGYACKVVAALCRR